MEVDLHVTGGLLVSQDGVLPRELYVSEGVVVAVAERPLAVTARSTVRLTGEWIWPGFVDSHVHFADPGHTDREDFGTGTAAALASGVTTVVEMPNTNPPVADAAALEAKLESVGEKALVDYALWGALLPGSIDSVLRLRESGVRCFKGFMYAYGTRGLPKLSDWDLVRFLELSSEHDLVVAVHAENHDLVAGASETLGTVPRQRFGEDHPLLAEEEAVRRAAFFADRTGGRLHIVHVTAGAVVRQITAARERGVRVTAETCPQYLLFSDEDGRRRGPWLRCAPPVRSSSERDELWRRAARGELDMIVSDHSPTSDESKRRGVDNLLMAPNGLQGVQTLVPSMITAWLHERRLPPEDLYRLCSRNPARLAGLHPRKGSLDPGSDADFAIVDMNREWVLTAADLRYKHPWSPWEGTRFSALVTRVFLRGVEAFSDGEVRVPGGFGRFLPARVPSPETVTEDGLRAP